jgi:hypothetical protein
MFFNKKETKVPEPEKTVVEEPKQPEAEVKKAE